MQTEGKHLARFVASALITAPREMLRCARHDNRLATNLLIQEQVRRIKWGLTLRPYWLLRPLRLLMVFNNTLSRLVRAARSFAFLCQLPRFLLVLLVGLSSPKGWAQQPKVQVLAVGFDHLSQLYTKQDARSDVFTPKKQAELAQLRARLARFRPDLILVEVEPQEQPHLDSVYAAYQQSLPLTAVPSGRSECYQVGFTLAKDLHLPAPRGINFYAATSQSLLRSGRNIDLFRQNLLALQTTARPLKRRVQHDSLSVYDYIALMNQPQLLELSHRAILNTPAYVTSGTFASPDPANPTDVGRVDTAYIGAHYISLFYNRNLKIYSNLLRVQQQTQAQRLLVIYGQNHIAVLQELLRVNPAYQVVSATTYLAPSRQALKLLKQ